MDFDHLSIFLWHLEISCLSFARWVHTYPASEPISRVWDYNPSFPWDIPFITLIWGFMEFFFIYEASSFHYPSLLPFSQFPLPYFHVFLWRRTCVNGGCAPLSSVDAQAWVNDSWIFNMSPIFYVSRNQNKYICKCPHFQALLWLVSMWWFLISMELSIWCVLRLG